MIAVTMNRAGKLELSAYFFQYILKSDPAFDNIS